MSIPAVNVFAGYSPGRPQNIRDLEQCMNGALNYLGVIVSTGAAVNNATTATPFNYLPTSSTSLYGGSLTGTLAGKALLIQPTAAGHVLDSPFATIGGSVTTVTTFSTVPPAAGTAPGAKIQAEERVPFFMSAANGWLQFIPTSGSANLFVWELI